MAKEIVWTITNSGHRLILKTSTKVDTEDQAVEIPYVALILAMKRLSSKYCNRGFAVLFDVDC